MLRALITSIPFKQTAANPEWNHLPRTILQDITHFIYLERLFHSNHPPLYNIKPFIHIAKNTTHHSLESIPIPQHTQLTKYAHSYLIDTFTRNLSIYNNSDSKLLISRNWIHYNQHSKLLRILSIREIFDYHVEFAHYLEYLNNTRCNPDFNARDLNHTKFLEQLQN